MTLLYLEKNQSVKTADTIAMDLAGIDVITAPDPDNALVVMNQFMVDVVLIGDIDGPEELLQKLKEKRVACARLTDTTPTDTKSDVPVWKRSNGVRLDLVSKICDLVDHFRGRPRSSALSMLRPVDCVVGFRGVVEVQR